MKPYFLHKLIEACSVSTIALLLQAAQNLTVLKATEKWDSTEQTLWRVWHRWDAQGCHTYLLPLKNETRHDHTKAGARWNPIWSHENVNGKRFEIIIHASTKVKARNGFLQFPREGSWVYKAEKWKSWSINTLIWIWTGRSKIRITPSHDCVLYPES